MIRHRLTLALPLIVALLALGAGTGFAQQSGPRATECHFESARFRLDSVPGVGQMVYAGGGVVIRCPARGIVLHGDSAERYPNHDQMIGHAVYDEPRFHVTADYLNYFPLEDRVVAVSNVHARLPSGSTLDGPQAEYLRPIPKTRPRAQMRAIARPTINIIERDSTGKAAEPTNIIANTVFVDGDSASLIYGSGQVVINRSNIAAQADSVFIDEDKETMRLMRQPYLRGKQQRPFTLRGDLIDLFSQNRKLQRVIARANATAVSDSMTLKSDTIDLRMRNELLDHAYAWGGKSRAVVVSPSQNMIADSLDVYMPAQHVQLVRAVRKALAQGRPDTSKFTLDRPDTLNWLQGDTIVAHFDSLAGRDTSKNPNIRQLVALGHASSLYHMAPSDTSVHKPALNHVTARVITIDFDKQAVATVTTVDSVSGIYIEPRPDTTAKRTNAKAKAATPATNRNPSTPAKPKAPASVIPLPSKPPNSP
jgi:lipopolysaccharide export system protein LptA